MLHKLISGFSGEIQSLLVKSTRVVLFYLSRALMLAGRYRVSLGPQIFQVDRC